ncbi:phytanoyl-CoA dioxygenase family protein [Xylaria cf. heliscus]|nr:phytanoyl-CoA dioxygenase family protein [Xylaria cf. heliscus]
MNDTTNEVKPDKWAVVIAHFREHGWAVVPSVLSKQRAAAILEGLWDAAVIQESRGYSRFNPFMDPNSSNVRVWYQPEIHNIFAELSFHPTALELVEVALGCRPILSNFNTNICRPGSESMALHSDQSLSYPGPWNHLWTVNAEWCLTDIREDNGATLYLPGSHKIKSRQELPQNAPELLVPYDAKAGDLILMAGTLWHTSGRNRTENENRAIAFMYYTAPHLRSQVNWTAKLSRNLQDLMTPEQRRILGLDDMVDLSAEGDFRYLSKQYPNPAETTEAKTNNKVFTSKALTTGARSVSLA